MSRIQLFRRAAVVLLLLSSRLSATTIVLPSDEQLIRKATSVVVGKVLRTGSVLRDGAIWTETVIAPEERLKGTGDGVVIVREVGGRIGNQMSVIFGAPHYTAGERVLVFLNATPRADYQTTDLFVGKFTERFARDGERIWYRDDVGSGVRLLDRNFQPLDVADVQRDALRFEEYVRHNVSGHAVAADYGVPSPRLRPSLAPEFTLIDEPSVYRWFAFDHGTNVPWKSVGSQAGYASGGVNEIHIAMSAWTCFPNANIRYTYSGNVATTTGGLNRQNGINEVIFGDPLSEVAGSWNGSDGVVGVGGFNNVANGGSWQSPFAADSAHPLALFPSAFNILEGNLVIQDGVSPQRGISSIILAEIVAHEFGHTLGFGHSADSSALMYFRVTGGGPTLHPDDQLAARWLYPGSGGAGNDTVPPSPSGLSGQSGSTSVQLTWNDNASSETKQTVYMARGSAGFVRLADLPANQSSYTASQLTKGETYSFRVTASNAIGESTPSNIVTVTLQSDAPIAAFKASPVNGVAGQTTLTFSDQSTGPIISWLWSFGDGATSTSQNANHLYANPGLYSVSLTVSAANGVQSVATHPVVITSPTAPVAAGFSFSPRDPSIIDTLNFVDESTGPVTSWKWTFGDNNTSTDANPSHRYVSAGSYSVTLEVQGNGTTSSLSRIVNVAGGSGGSTTVLADFETIPPAAVASQAVSFRDKSTGNPNSWYWQFGDGFSSTQQNPTHTYNAPGSFTVTLSAGNLLSSSTRARTIVVTDPALIFRSVIPVAAETVGANGYNWRTELTIFNNGAESSAITFRFIPSEGAVAATTTATIAKGASVTFSNSLKDLFAIEQGAGAIVIQAIGTTRLPALRVASRTFTNSSSGSYGQFVPDVSGAQSALTSYLTGLRSTAAFRSNIGLVNISNAATTLSLVLFSSEGQQIASSTLSIPAGSFQQRAIEALFPSLQGSNENLSLQITASSPDAVLAYGSVVDNRTQDPVYVSAVPRRSESQLVLPAVARAPGAASTFWRSDVTIFNPGRTAMNFSLSFLASGADNRAAVGKALTIAGGSTMTINDVTTWIGAGDQSGALRISWNDTLAPIVTSRTYTERASDGGSYGQSIDPLERFASDMSVTGLQSDASFRTNLGIVSAAGAPIDVILSLLNTEGKVVGTSRATLAPLSQMQASTASLFGIDVSALGHFVVTAHSDGGEFFVYGSVIDNASGDPIFIAGR